MSENETSCERVLPYHQTVSRIKKLDEASKGEAGLAGVSVLSAGICVLNAVDPYPLVEVSDKVNVGAAIVCGVVAVGSAIKSFRSLSEADALSHQLDKQLDAQESQEGQAAISEETSKHLWAG